MDNLDTFAEIPSLSGDPSTIAQHDQSEYCMDITKPSSDENTSRYIRWYTFEKKQAQQDKQFLDKFSSTVSPYSHTCMNDRKGGLKIPADDEPKFLNWYARVWADRDKHRTQLYIVEKCSPVIRLFIDFDFKQLRGVSPDGIAALATVTNKVVQRFYPDHGPFRYIVCCSNYTESTMLNKENVSVKVVKTGVHIHWPDIFIRSEQILDMRESIIAELQNIFGQREPPMNDWKDVFDLKPYDHDNKLGTGLRMVGSLKAEECPNKKLKTCNKECSICAGEGKINTDGHGRPYLLFLASDGTKRDIEAEKMYLQNFPKLLQDTKLRTIESVTPGYVVPQGAPLYLAMHKEASKRVLSRAKQIVHGDKRYQIIQDAIRGHLLYARVVVTQVNQKEGNYLVHVSGDNSRFCQNIGREHRSNRIWFLVTKDGISQKCHDDTDVLTAEMKFGLCRDYSSSTWPLNTRQLVILFPDLDDSSTSVAKQTTNHRATQIALESALQYIDRLCKLLHNSLYTSTLLVNHTSFYKQGREYAVVYPEHLGSLHTHAMNTLGFQTDELPDDPDDPDDIRAVPIKSFGQFQDALVRSFTNIIDFVCFTSQINRNATSMDEIRSMSMRLEEDEDDI